MMLFGHDADVVQWAEQKWGTSVGRVPDLAIGLLDPAGVLRGALMLTTENAATATLSVYSEGMITHGVAKSFFGLCFDEWGITRLQMRTQKSNKAIKRAAPKMGFTFEGVAKGYYGPGRDALVFYMTPQSCRWIKAHGHRKAA